MNNLNTVLVEGLLTRDPERQPLTSETSMCRMSIANNRYYANKNREWKQETSFFTVIVFGNVAEACLNNMKKGRGIRVVGRLKQQIWEKGGIRRETVVIYAEHIEFQPEKKTEKLTIPEPVRLPGEIITTADLKDLEPQPQYPECTLETNEIDESDRHDAEDGKETF